MTYAKKRQIATVATECDETASAVNRYFNSPMEYHDSEMLISALNAIYDETEVSTSRGLTLAEIDMDEHELFRGIGA